MRSGNGSCRCLHLLRLQLIPDAVMQQPVRPFLQSCTDIDYEAQLAIQREEMT